MDKNTITITATQPLALVAYREVDDPVWHAATEETSGRFTAVVHGPYWVTTVCIGNSLGKPQAFFEVWRAGRTLDDPHELDARAFCFVTAPEPLPRVTGELIERTGDSFATVALSNAVADVSFATFNPAADEGARLPFSLSIPPGAYTLYAYDADHITIRHDLDVAHSLSLPTIDLGHEGSALVPTTFTPSNFDPIASIHSVTRIEHTGSRDPFQIIDARFNNSAVIANAALTASDNQTVSVQADVFKVLDNVDRDENVASRRPWRLGDDPTFVEPAQIGDAAWSFDARDQLVASWSSLPPTSQFSSEIDGTNSLGDFVFDNTVMSGSFITATAPKRIVLDTSIPGFQSTWVVDYKSKNRVYTRNLFAQNVLNPASPDDGAIITSDIVEVVSPPAQTASRAAHATLPAVAKRPRLPGMPYAR